MAVATCQLALDYIPDGHDHLLSDAYSTYLSHLQSRLVQLGRLTDVEDAITAGRLIVKLTPAEHPSTSIHLSNLGRLLLTRSNFLIEDTDLEEAILMQRSAVDSAPPEDADKALCLTNLALSLRTRFERLDQLTDLEDAISFSHRAAELIPDTHPYKSTCLENLGLSLRSRFKRLGEVADLEQAILVQRSALEAIPGNHPRRSGYLNDLAISLRVRFRRLGELSDLDNAITTLRNAMDLTPEGHPWRISHLSNLASSLGNRFKRLGDLTDLESAILAQREVLTLTPNGARIKPRRLNNLGISLKFRFDRVGELAALDDAIAVQRSAVELTPDENPDKAEFLNNLAVSIRIRFMRLGELVDLENAIAVERSVIRLTPDRHPEKPRRLNNLSNSLRIRFERLGDLGDIEDTISAQRSAVELTPDGNPDKPVIFNNLAFALRTRFQRLGELADLDEAIAKQRIAKELTPDEHVDRSHRLGVLGGLLQSRFERLGEPGDVEEATSLLQDAVALTPYDHYERSARLLELGMAWRTRLNHSLDPSHFKLAYNSFLGAVRTEPCPPNGRLVAALAATSLCAEFPELVPSQDTLLQAYKLVLEAIPPFIWLGQSVSHRFKQLSTNHQIGESIVAAAAAAITAGKIPMALEWLEEGRALIWGQHTRLRSPMEGLRARHPELADELQRVSASLQNIESRDDSAPSWDSTLEDEARRHRDQAQYYDDLLVRIRALDGFESFLCRKGLAELAPACQSGPVAVLTVHSSRCDALVLCPPGRVIHVPLPDFSLALANKMYLMISDSIRGRDARFQEDRAVMKHNLGRDDMRRVLRLLWYRAVQPVLSAIESELVACSAPNELPRIIWCATGPLAFLPLHAAGVYDTPGGLKAPDLIVSSYTPSLNALITRTWLAAGEGPRSIPDPRIFVASQPDTPDIGSPLPYTTIEAEALSRQFSCGSVTHLNHERATVDAVVDGMERHAWVHLACHGIQDQGGDPTKSAFFLYDGRLSLERIMRMDLDHAELAVLSACQTAKGDERLPEEAAHLAAGMLAAGYKAVVATMWSIADRDGPVLSDALYMALRRNHEGREAGGDLRVAYALHEAVTKLRSEVGEESFARWVPFIHLGI
ncbi:CHAT domain-containing protein [Vararia minispora EC-137]|uniref:CHAT domain-containing protein n=1 Tax=Vararia minispora EC-137 TaxID=1314806 RepID=A0ACB8Q6F4_9AGAM|nr:CHAT domain-containing protein [Vararia minispora EC-137]